jgi:hypothetical protein
MDDRKHSISPDALYARLGSETAPIIVDVRRDADFASADTLVADAFHCSPDDVEEWRTDLPSGRQVVNFPDDHEMLKHGMVIYDALYTWSRSLQAETHNWPARV